MKICFKFSEAEKKYLLTKKISKSEIAKLIDGFDLQNQKDVNEYINQLAKLIDAYK
jgi:hypothetical protein